MTKEEREEAKSNNLCISCTNIGCIFQSGIVRTKCAFYMPPHIEPDNCGNILDKIRADVEKLPITDTAVKLVAEVLDKYRAESER